MKDNRAVGAPQDRWGTPDPRNENDYPAPDLTRPAQWAWELLRRRSDFRKAWTEIIEPLCDPSTGKIDGTRIDEAMDMDRYLDRRTGYLKTDQALPPYVKPLLADGSGFKVTNPLLEMAARFGLKFFGRFFFGQFDPRHSERPLFQPNFITVFCSMASEESKAASIQLERGKVLIEFNVTVPLDGQLDQARSVLEGFAREAQSATDIRPQWEKFPTYLRALDAEAADISDAEAAKFLCPKIDDEYPAYRGRKFVQNARAAAKRWQEDYLALAAVDADFRPA